MMLAWLARLLRARRAELDIERTRVLAEADDLPRRLRDTGADPETVRWTVEKIAEAKRDVARWERRRARKRGAA
jgi:hypothetical protein